MPTGSTPFGRVMHPPGSIHSLLIEEDPPQSLKWRQPLYPWFSPATVKRWHPKMVAYTTWFIAQKIETGAMDLVVDLTSALPTVITLTHLGVSVDRWGEYASAKPQEDHPCGIRIAAYAVMSELIASVVEVVADRRTNPRPDDFPTVVSQMEIDGEKLTDEEILGVCSTIVGAGIDTTTALLAQAFVHLDQNRDDRQRLIEQPELLTSTTEEFLR